MRPQRHAPAAALAALLAASAVAQQPAEAPPPARQAELVRLVRQDCGSCHGIRLTGGLGPALTPEALHELPPDSLAAVIFNGRPGTAMPGWKPFLSAAEAHWIAQQLQAGFPQEGRTSP